jgi:hypothetical protein
MKTPAPSLRDFIRGGLAKDKVDKTDKVWALQKTPPTREIGLKKQTESTRNKLASASAPIPSSDILKDLTLVYCTSPKEASALIEGMLLDANATGTPLAVDIETAPHQSEIDRLVALEQELANNKGEIKAKRKASAEEHRAPAPTAEAPQGEDRVRKRRRARPSSGADPAGADLRRWILRGRA